jgi:hypothetical protein
MWFAAAVAAACVWVPAGAMHAQAAGTALLHGTVYDSTAMQSLAGARVGVIGTSIAGQSDGEGRFAIADVPAGSFRVSFFHDRLRELGLSSMSQPVAFEAGETVFLELTVPSEETLLLGWCLTELAVAGSGAVAGLVTDELTGVPMPHTLVTAEPAQGSVGPTVETTTNEAGYFRICEAPAQVELALQAHFGQRSSEAVSVVLEPGRGRLQDLVLPMSTEGTLTGYVTDYVSGDPVQGAVVSVLGTSSAVLTDVDGRFMMDDLPPARHLVSTDHLAFEERTDSVTIFGDETVDIEVLMATEALEVEGLVIAARTRSAEQSLLGAGQRADVMSREDIEVALPGAKGAVDLLRRMNTPGLRVRDGYLEDEITGVMIPGLCIEVGRRSPGSGCASAAVALNDVIVIYPDLFLRSLDPNVIDRIEVLTPLDAQFRFGPVASNGAIMIYTH